MTGTMQSLLESGVFFWWKHIEHLGLELEVERERKSLLELSDGDDNDDDADGHGKCKKRRIWRGSRDPSASTSKSGAFFPSEAGRWAW